MTTHSAGASPSRHAARRGRSPRRCGALLAASLGLTGATGCGGQAGPEGPRHVLLVSLDTTRADHLGCYGGAAARTPALDALAAEGVRFADCTAAAATTLASHASLVTGTYPRTHGVPRNGFVLHPDNETLAERLGAAGFWCAAFLGSFALDARFRFDQGFDHFDASFDVPVGVHGADQDQRRAAAVTDAALAHVDEVRARRGFAQEGRLFLFAHYFDPHAPYDPPGAAGPPGSLPRIGAAVVAQQRAVLGEDPPGPAGVAARGLPRELLTAAPAAPSEEDRALAALYAGEVEAVDRELGRLLVGLEQRGLLDDTLVIVTADHGETFWEHPNHWNHGLWVHQTDVHVPLLVRPARSAGAVAGRVVTTPVSTVDVAPTVLAQVGLAPGARVEGRDLSAALAGAALDAGRPVFAEATQPGAVLEPDPERAGSGARWWNDAKPRAARLGPLKLVEAPYLGYEALFDVVRDPLERRDLAADPAHAEGLARLRAALEVYRASGPPLPSRFDPEQSLDSVRRLRALGYFESGR